MQTATAMKAPLSILAAPMNPKLELEAWPAPGGGLLLSAHLAPYDGSGFRVRANLFLLIPMQGRPSVMAPYAALSLQSRDWMTDIVSDELDLREDGVIFIATASQQFPLGPIDGTIMLFEWQLRGLAAVAHHLLVSEAREVLGLAPASFAGPENSINNFASGASLQAVPASVVTRCGRLIDVMQQTSRSPVDSSARS